VGIEPTPWQTRRLSNFYPVANNSATDDLLSDWKIRLHMARYPLLGYTIDFTPGIVVSLGYTRETDPRLDSAKTYYFAQR